MGIRTKITTKGIDNVKTPGTTPSDFRVEVEGQVMVPWVWSAAQRQRSVDIVDGQTTFFITSSVTIAAPPAAGATGILPGITGSWVGQMFTVAKYGTAALTISGANEIKGTGSFTMTLTGSQYATIPGLGGASLPGFNSANVATFMSATSGSGYVWYVI